MAALILAVFVFQPPEPNGNVQPDSGWDFRERFHRFQKGGKRRIFLVLPFPRRSGGVGNASHGPVDLQRLQEPFFEPIPHGAKANAVLRFPCGQFFE